MLCFAVWLWTVGGRQIPVEVFGGLPTNEVAEITKTVRSEMRRQILPDLSWRSLKGMPSALKRYSSVKLFTIMPWGNQSGEFAQVTAWTDGNRLPRYYFSNGWYYQRDTGPKFDAAYTNAQKYDVYKDGDGWKL